MIAPPKALAERAVKAMQILLGSVDRVSPRDEQRLRNRVRHALEAIEKKTGQSASDWWPLVEREARRRGLRIAIPGKDL